MGIQMILMNSSNFTSLFHFCLYLPEPWDWPWPFPTTSIMNTTISQNYRGMMAQHYDQPSNEFLDLFQRYRWETVSFYGVSFLSNSYESLYVLGMSRYNVLYMPTYVVLQQTLRIAEITYDIVSCHFADNGIGVVAGHSVVVEYSNNIWIWRLSGSLFERNHDGGFVIELPKVNMMYTQLFNHSIDVNATVFQNNQNFAFRIDGFYCNSSIVSNTFQGNVCKLGCITIAGTEKDFDMSYNQIVENTGRYIVQFNMDSHTPFTRWVDSLVSYNIIKRNLKLNENHPPTATSSPTTYAFGVLGLQNVTINRNLFGNSLDFELLGGQSSSLLENYLDVTENYWGTVNQAEINALIFDFDDWNSYAIAEYFPFLTSNNYNGQPFVGNKILPILDLSKPIGGRITEDLHLMKRSTPYIVSRDLTIMNGVSLLIDAGVELQFYPNVGILVLGSLVAVGTPSDRLKFNPILRTKYKTNRVKRQIAPSDSKIIHSNIDPILGYQIKLVGGPNSDEGFIQVYNVTAKVWTIVCDDSFNDRTAEVACRTMGRESSNVVVRTNPYYDIFVLGYQIMHEQQIEWFWRQTLICDGSETSMEQCRYQINYKLPQCMVNRNYVFVRCGPRNLPPEYEYWGNIRFSTPTYETGKITPGYSSLQYLDIYGGGILHDERSGAIQAIYRLPDSSYVRIHNCDWNGYEYVAPMDVFSILYNIIQNINGFGIGVTVLNGMTSTMQISQFTPLVKNSVPFDVYGMIRMCTVEKLVYVQDRALLYFKYTFDTIDCIKVVRSKEPRKQISVRFLQINMYNDTLYHNAVEMYNGEYFDPTQLIVSIDCSSSATNLKQQYITSTYYDTMGIRVTASPAYETYGFVVEVTTLPLSPIFQPDYGENLMHFDEFFSR